MNKIHNRQSIQHIRHTIAESVKDAKITEHERTKIVAAFDRNGDGLTTDDFSGIGSTQFTELHAILRAHGIDIIANTQSQTVRIHSFQDYNPEANAQQQHIPNPFLKQYFTQKSHAKMLTAPDWARTHTREIPIENIEAFTRDIFSVASELGYSEQDMRSMSIHDAVLLAGKLTAHRLEYHHNMISEEEKQVESELKANPKAVLEKFMRGERPPSNAEALRIDNMPPDIVFAKQQGICRNYAVVNVAVFTALKRINPNLHNTYMTNYVPESLGHGYALPHAWNMVTTIGDKFLDVTFVDPTWLDTRSRTTFNDTNAESKPTSEIETFYNAVDEAHFGKAQQYIDLYMATMYEEFAAAQAAGGNARQFHTAESIVAELKHRAFQYRARYTSKRLATPLENLTPGQRPHALSNTAHQVVPLITNATEQPTTPELLITYGTQGSPLRPEMRDELLAVYKEIQEKHPELLKQPISYLKEENGRTKAANTTLQILFEIVLK